ncbi:MAG: carboxypeptidase regulatory-like domain-containing protein [Vicinamibacterales bacterium]
MTTTPRDACPPRPARARHVALLVALGACTVLPPGAMAADLAGRLTLGEQPVPGAIVAASRDDERRMTSSDEEGRFRFTGLAEGEWTLTITMQGFSTRQERVQVRDGLAPVAYALQMLGPDDVVAGSAPDRNASGAPDRNAGGAPDRNTVPPAGVVRVDASPVPTGGAGAPQAVAEPSSGSRPAGTGTPAEPGPGQDEPARDAPPDSAPEGLPGGSLSPALSALGAAEGLLLDGSVNNGAASPLAQAAAFGNNRRRPGALYNAGLGVFADTSALDAQPYSAGRQPVPAATYTDVHLLATFGGPLPLPGVRRNRPTLFAAYRRTAEHTASTQLARVPSDLERQGDFSQTRDAFGQPVVLRDPGTGRPLSGARLPTGWIAPEAAALLAYYPRPNLPADGQYNFQRAVLTAREAHAWQSRLTQPLSTRQQLAGTLAWDWTTTGTTNLFGFDNDRRASNVDASATWSYRLSPFTALRLRYQLTRATGRVDPYFAGSLDVAAAAGIGGASRDPADWGPPSLSFVSGLAGLSDVAPFGSARTQHGVTGEILSTRGRHFLSTGGEVRPLALDITGTRLPRGSFAFTGSATGVDLGDLLLGRPDTAALSTGNADVAFTGRALAAWLNDDWRVSPGLTITLGIRWEYDAPLAERAGRVANLDLAPDFTAASVVTGQHPLGATTGQVFPASLLRPDRSGIQPRVGVAWRPVAGSSLVIRGGYGRYRSTGIYEAIVPLLAQQPPLATAFRIHSAPAEPLTLSAGLLAPREAAVANTLAVDPDLRVGATDTWQASVQQDLPGSLTLVATYAGTRGRHQPQQSLPNTHAPGSVSPCPSCPSGFVYLTSNGRARREAASLQVRRRLRGGLAAAVQYTYARAWDDAAAALTGAVLADDAIAQDWQRLEAEWAPSRTDQRHQVVAGVQYTTGIGRRWLQLGGLAGPLLRGWTLMADLTAGSGRPFTPTYLGTIPGSGVTGPLRASLTGVPDTPAGEGYANPDAYARPAPGTWGTAGRHSIRGPAQFDLNAGIGRTFTRGDRIEIDWRLDATNVLNRVTWASLSTLVGSPQFGLPDRANVMRKVLSSLRVRF